MHRGIIVSIQGFGLSTTRELSKAVISAGASALRLDKPVKSDVPIIGLNKIKVNNPYQEPYITPTCELISKVAQWAQYVAIDMRRINKHVKFLGDYCRREKIKIVADIGDMDDYDNLIKCGVEPAFITTCFSVFRKKFKPDISFAKKLVDQGCKNIIAEGNYLKREDVRKVLEYGVHSVCMGGAISNVYKLARRYTTIQY